MLFDLLKKIRQNIKINRKSDKQEKENHSIEQKNESEDNTQNSRVFPPIVFVNNPLNKENEDVIGLNSIIASINSAIKKGAKMIGIIANYGTGKSSLIELLAKSSVYNKVIKINMWGCTNKEINDVSSISVSNLTKSFLYQLASGCSIKLAQYVNKRLSKNYGIISFSIRSKRFWAYIIPALLFFACYFSINNTSDIGIWNILLKLKIDLNPWAAVVKLSSSVFLLGSIVLGFIGLKQTNIAYSHWKNQNERETEINDVFDIYNDIAIDLCKKRDCKALVVIEDLDRIGNKNIVIGFLRELYRFHNLLKEKHKSKLAFIISIKPESELNIIGTDNFDDDKNTFSKFFDFVVNLKTIHFEDHENIILSLIDSLESESKKEFIELTDIKSNDKLPKSFYWLMQGEELTIRKIKDRLNQAINLCINLKNKDYENASVNFEACAAVTYLETTYGNEYYELIKHETKFADLIEQSYKIKNNKTLPDKSQKIKDIINELKLGITKCVDDLVKMILKGTIDEDFRMYFYTYPKGSYIKTSEEKDLSNLLLLPNDYTLDGDIDEKVNKILEKQNKTRNNKKDILFDCIVRINSNILNGEDENFPPIVLQNEYIFKLALGINYDKILDLVDKETTWQNETMHISANIFSRICSYKFDNRSRFLKHYSDKLLNKLNGVNPILIIKCREKLINILAKEIEVFQMLFISANMPFISQEELNIINDNGIILKLIDINRVDTVNINNLAPRINEVKINDQDYNIAKNIYKRIMNPEEQQKKSKFILEFLSVNNVTDDELFNYLYNQVLKVDIINYVNKLPLEAITINYLNKLDELLIQNGLSENIIGMLEKNDLYNTYLLSMAQMDKLKEIEYSDNRVKKLILLAATKINGFKDTIVRIRKTILETSQKSISDYSVLFKGDYPIITKSELNLFDSSIDSLSYIKLEGITEENYPYFCEFFNQENRNSEDCYTIFVDILNERNIPSIAGPITAKMLNELDFSRIDFKNMSPEQKQDACVCIFNAMELSNAGKCIVFMQKVSTLIRSLEVIVVGAGMIKEYLSLMNDINQPTDFTIQWIKGNMIDFALSQNITSKLLEDKEYTKYIIGKTIADGELAFDIANIKPEYYIEAYNLSDNAFEIMKKNKEFLNYIILNKLYIGFEKKRCKPLYELGNSLDLFQYLFGLFNDESELKEYLIDSPPVEDKELGKSYIDYIKDGDNYRKFNNREIQELFKKKLHKNQKTSFTLLMKSKFPDL